MPKKPGTMKWWRMEKEDWDNGELTWGYVWGLSHGFCIGFIFALLLIGTTKFILSVS